MRYFGMKEMHAAYAADGRIAGHEPRHYLRDSLHAALASQVPSGPGSETPDLYLYELYHSAPAALGAREGGALQAAVRFELAKLALRFPVEGQGDLFWAYLFSLIGLLKAEDACEALVPIAKDEAGQLRGARADGEDLYLRMLKAMLACRTRSQDALAVCLRDLDAPRYAEVCFDAIYRSDLYLGLRELPRFLKAHWSDPVLLPSGIVLDVLGDMTELRANPADVSNGLRSVGIPDVRGFLVSHFSGVIGLSVEVHRRLERLFDTMLGWSTALITPSLEWTATGSGLYVDVGRAEFPAVELAGDVIPEAFWLMLV